MPEYSLPVPRPVQKGFDILVALPKSAFEELLSAVNEIHPVPEPQLLLDRLASLVTSIDADSLKEISQTIVSFVSGIGTLGLTEEEFTDAIVRGSAEDLTSSKQKLIRGRLLNLFQAVPLMLTSKAVDLRNEAPNTFVSARVLTDIRPIFHDDPTKAPGGLIIIHTLKLVFHSGSHHRELYVGIDEQDMAQLHEVLSRAEVKSQSLISMLKSGEFHLISEENNNGDLENRTPNTK